LVPVSDLCEELGLQPTVFYRWQKEFFENGAAAFQTTEHPRRQAEEKQKRIEFLEKKVQTKDNSPVINLEGDEWETYPVRLISFVLSASRRRNVWKA
jgi:transposase-like protein